jgi:hypothetical protein
MSDYRPTTTDAITYLRFKLDNAQRDDDLPDVAVSVDADTLSLALSEFHATRARVSALEDALRDCLRVFDGVAAGTASIDEDVPVSLMAEMCAHFNGYEGGPDITRTAAHVRDLLGGDA